ncbi:hypothetical protein V2665_08485 [Tenacibaculum maritimum]|uniref:hypothetical protein n=2 Tax=Tenacibaculum maritimum TaxID=107401 RepID=UPI0012E66420|nr:hypothetical protein [Tenacibaculum maritimum]CAA0150107.1 exported hypothetical protein [Tenacibaculum maritimum]
MKKVILLLLMFSFIGVNATPLKLNTEKDNPTSIVKTLDNDFTDNLLSLSINTQEKNIFPVKLNREFDLGLSFKSYHSYFIASATKNNVKQKQALIIDKIKEYIPDFNITKESKRNPKRIERVFHSNCETYFLNKDSSKIRLITFVRNTLEINKLSNNFNISVTESYY